MVCDWCRVGAGGSVGENATERKVEAKKMPFTDKLKQMGAGLDTLVPLVSVLAPPQSADWRYSAQRHLGDREANRGTGRHRNRQIDSQTDNQDTHRPGSTHPFRHFDP